jgi:hypothetical protein
MQRDLWKESLNSDGQQFHQYQQNKQSPLIVTHLTLCVPVEGYTRHTSKLDIYVLF